MIGQHAQFALIFSDLPQGAAVQPGFCLSSVHRPISLNSDELSFEYSM